MRIIRVLAVVLTGIVLAASDAAAQQSTMPPDAKVYILWPPDGAVIHGGFWVRMGLSGAGIAPAGVEKANTGHHHLLIDSEAPADMSAPLPATDKIVHFGKGQTETTLTTLKPGKHTLQLLLADPNHVPHQPPVISKKITITVAP